MVIFAPSNESLHGVRARYDHLSAQRTQLYGNLWYKYRPRLDTPQWEDFVIKPGRSSAVRGADAIARKLRRALDRGEALTEKLLGRKVRSNKLARRVYPSADPPT